MKFQKSLIAAALAVVGFGAQAATVTESGEANVHKYSNGEDVLYKIKVTNDEGTVFADGWYKQAANGELSKFEGDVAGFSTLISGGQLETTISYDDQDPIVAGGDLSDEARNYYYAYNNSVTIPGSTVGFEMTGQLVNTELTGRDGIDPEEEIAAAYPLEQLEPTGSLVKKDIEIGNLTKESLDSTSNRDFTIAGDNVYGTVATAAASTTTTVTSTSVTGLTGNGLTVVDAPVGSIVDLEKGTVTTVKLSDDAVTTRAELQAFATEDGARVFEIQNKYYQVEGNKLVDFKGDVDELTLVGAGVADTTTGGSVDTLVNTGFVSSQNVTYGESKTSVVNGTSINVASTNPNVANPESGDVYQVTAAGQTTSSSKDVKTGIIAVDQAGNKTYGLQATNTTDGKVTAQTTVTAAGIETTGDIAFVDAATGAKTSVKGYLEETSKAVDAKVDAALVEVDSRLTQFNSTAARLNSRIDDVEQTAYRGVAIALAAQQQIPNIGAGQFAVFGGVGHYEGETAGALGVASVFADGRTSLSAALGFAGGNEVGGRVGVSYVFGGK